MTRHETDMRLAMTLAIQRAGSFSAIIDGIKLLNRHSRTLHRMAEEDWNRGLTIKESTRCNATEKRAAILAKSLGGTIEVKYDPRAGCGIVLKVGAVEFYLANAQGR